MDRNHIESLYLDLREAAEFAWLGAPLPQERTITFMVKFSGALRQALQALSNLPDFPYESDPGNLIRHATLMWCQVLTEKLITDHPELEEALRTVRWERERQRQRQHIERMNEFRSLLQHYAAALGGTVRGGMVNETFDILRNIYKLGAELADPALRVEFSHAAASQEMITRAVEWLETIPTGHREWLDDVFKLWLNEGAEAAA